MASGYGNVVNYSYITIGSSTNFDPITWVLLLSILVRLQILGINNMENLLIFIRKTLQNYVVALRFFYSYNIDYLIFVRDLEWEVGVA